MKKVVLSLTIVCLYDCAVLAQNNYLNNYIGNTVTLTTIGSSSNLISSPRDLDFKPYTNELWLVNYGTSSGGTNVIFYDAGLASQTSEYRKDSHTGHFMVYPSAIAFGDDGKWATVSEIKNSVGNTSATFMGPALMSSDTSIFAIVFQNNWLNGYPLGSHLSMLHQSPYGMGIAHDSAMIYWVLDGHNGNICKYDYVEDHGPGYDDHSAGKIWRYTDVTFTRVANVPSHCVLDKSTGWLYYIEGGSKTIRRMDTNSGSQTGTLSPPGTGFEFLAGYWKVEDATVEILDTLSTQPCGIDFCEGWVIVSDYDNGNIYLYTTSGSFTLAGTIVTGHPGMMGVKVGPDGHIWCVNQTESILYRLDAGTPALDVAIAAITYPLTDNYHSNFYSTAFNVCDGNITPAITIVNNGNSTVSSMTIEYTIDGGTPVGFTWSGSLSSGSSASVSLPVSTVGYGAHTLLVTITDIGGYPDDVVSNNSIMGSFRVVAPPVGLSFTEEFTQNVFPPDQWNYIHFNPNNYISHSSVGGFGNSSGSMKMDNFSGPMNIAGQADYLMPPIIDFSSSTSVTDLKFSVAYAMYNSSSQDELKILASIDCGNTWSQIYDKKGSTLSTAPNATNAWTPSATQWRTDSVNLASYAGQPEVILMFTSISDYGNNLYIDDISIQGVSVGISDVNTLSSIEVFPNPATDVINIKLNGPIKNDAVIRISDAEGKVIYTQTKIFDALENVFTVSIREFNLTPGIYFLSIQNDQGSYYQKIVIQ